MGDAAMNIVEERHTISVLVDNEPGVLARVIGLFPAGDITLKA